MDDCFGPGDRAEARIFRSQFQVVRNHIRKQLHLVKIIHFAQVGKYANLISAVFFFQLAFQSIKFVGYGNHKTFYSPFDISQAA